MAKMLASGKGQMSFDMAFAVVLILMIFAMLAGYFQKSSSSASKTSELVALSAMADYTAGSLQALYNSLSYAPDSSANYTLEMKNNTMYGDSDNRFIVNYTAQLRDAGRTIRFTSGGSGPYVDRSLGFTLNGCSIVSGAVPGDKIKMAGCDVTGSTLTCQCSKI